MYQVLLRNMLEGNLIHVLVYLLLVIGMVLDVRQFLLLYRLGAPCPQPNMPLQLLLQGYPMFKEEIVCKELYQMLLLSQVMMLSQASLSGGLILLLLYVVVVFGMTMVVYMMLLLYIQMQVARVAPCSTLRETWPSTSWWRPKVSCHMKSCAFSYEIWISVASWAFLEP